MIIKIYLLGLLSLVGFVLWTGVPGSTPFPAGVSLIAVPTPAFATVPSTRFSLEARVGDFILFRGPVWSFQTLPDATQAGYTRSEWAGPSGAYILTAPNKIDLSVKGI